jgi:hypothetical protein
MARPQADITERAAKLHPQISSDIPAFLILGSPTEKSFGDIFMGKGVYFPPFQMSAFITRFYYSERSVGAGSKPTQG